MEPEKTEKAQGWDVKTVGKWILFAAAGAVIASHMGVGGLIDRLASLLPVWGK